MAVTPSLPQNLQPMEREAPFKVKAMEEDEMLGGSARPNTTPPQLIFRLLPGNRPEPFGVRTPPLRPPGSIPFQWEDAPGKPKHLPSSNPVPAAPPGLNLPPRLMTNLADEAEEKDVARHPFPLMKSRSSRERRRRGGRRERFFKEMKVFWAWGRKKGKKAVAINGFRDSSRNLVMEGMEEISPSSSSSSSATSESGLQNPWLGRSRSTGAGLSFCSASPFWGEIYGNLKQLIPRRR